MNNQVINHDIYAEITNGLFFASAVIFGVGTDDPEEFTFRQRGIQIVPRGITEIINQLESPQEFVPLTRQDIEEVVSHVFSQDRPIHERDIVLYTGSNEYNISFEEAVQREVERARIENERLSLNLSNMSEQQLLEHFDRISQEE